jgi:hypothetical protein
MKMLISKALPIFAALAIACGCATSSSPGPKKQSDPTAWHNDKDLQRVWLVPDFDFSGYDGIYIGETKFTAKERANEAEIRAWAIKYLRDRLAGEVARVGVVHAVYLNTNDIPANTKVLMLDNTIYEYEKGGGGARYFAGLYGAGQPVIAVRGVMTANNEPVFRFEATRKGESGTARVFGGFRSDESIQTEDIDDLARDFADFIHRTATHVSK